MFARGYSTLEYHEHTHMVMIGRGKGQLLLGDEIYDVAQGDFIEIPGNTIHQFRANKGDYIGFFCLVNKDRDKVKLLTDEQMETLRQNLRLRNFWRDYEYMDTSGLNRFDWPDYLVLPHTEAIKPEGWHLLAIFTATIVGFILRPWPTGIMALFGIVAAVATSSITMVQALGGYAEANVWLIVAAVFFSRGIINSGLGKRIAYTLIRAFGTSSLKLAYALACTDLIISPATPSNTARGGGIIFPIVQNISLCF